MMKFALIAAAAAGALAMASQASANALSGSIWEGDASGDASVVPAGAPTSTFTPGAINYDSRVTGYTIGQFLNGASMSNPGIAGDSMLDTHIEITGMVGLHAGNNTFDIIHDDGIVVTIAGIGFNFSQPGPTAPVDSPFTVFNPGASGNYAFTLEYNECCGAPAALIWDVNNLPVGVPEPATWAMMILGVAGIGAAMRRRQALVAA